MRNPALIAELGVAKVRIAAIEREATARRAEFEADRKARLRPMERVWCENQAFGDIALLTARNRPFSGM